MEPSERLGDHAYIANMSTTTNYSSPDFALTGKAIALRASNVTSSDLLIASIDKSPAIGTSTPYTATTSSSSISSSSGSSVANSAHSVTELLVKPIKTVAIVGEDEKADRGEST